MKTARPRIPSPLDTAGMFLNNVSERLLFLKTSRTEKLGGISSGWRCSSSTTFPVSRGDPVAGAVYGLQGSLLHSDMLRRSWRETQTYGTLCIQTFLCISQGIMNHKEYSSHWCTSVERSVVLLQETNQRRCSVIHYDLSWSTGVFLVNTWRMAWSSDITVHTLRKTNSKATSARHHVRQVSKARFTIQLSETTFWES